ncbi:hypothetical protein OIU34_02395 [Pararhizobium sp. BT-229]|uniref:hypothetical protein n=1 Tax=Pararhizobium sp. BT-229 TaxID=2986923 RepID=UPI0021F7DC34|nr:hypothetical protein [Pararhizobium sp. BT-229]MCV9960737.1 hypothetical protein [Pararhizobium sp. BT-229]
MKYVALKAFPLSRDGIHIEDVAKGSHPDVPEGLVEGLKAAGLIAEDASAERGDTSQAPAESGEAEEKLDKKKPATKETAAQ